jgi:hypothetical protein
MKTLSNTTQAKIKQLGEIILANYTAAQNYDPAFATQCAMELILKMVMGQPHYIDQLLDEEIEDNLKARA